MLSVSCFITFDMSMSYYRTAPILKYRFLQFLYKFYILYCWWFSFMIWELYFCWFFLVLISEFCLRNKWQVLINVLFIKVRISLEENIIRSYILFVRYASSKQAFNINAFDDHPILRTVHLWHCKVFMFVIFPCLGNFHLKLELTLFYISINALDNLWR